MKKILSIILSVLLTSSTFATSNTSIKELILKYNYNLNSHPKAHISEFRKKTTDEFKEELKEQLSTYSEEEAKKEFLQILQQIPSKESRESLMNGIESLTNEDLLRLSTDLNLLERAIKGEGSNFTSSSQLDMLKTISTVAIMAAIAIYFYIDTKRIIDENKNKDYEDFYSYGLYIFTSDQCTHSSLTYMLTEQEKISMESAVMNKCEISAIQPETCSFSGFVINKNYYDDNECIIKAKATASSL